jgi:rubrerythrin
VKKKQMHELLLQALETELGGVRVYEAALENVLNDELREEWSKYLEQTREHVDIVTDLLGRLGIESDQETPGRQVVRGIGESLVRAIEQARSAGEREAAQLVAAECVVLAETKDHLNWELIGEIAKEASRAERDALHEAHGQVEEDEDKHLYHSTGWCRELWLSSLGLPAVLPPPEEEKDVTTAIGAARAKQQREEMI